MAVADFTARVLAALESSPATDNTTGYTRAVVHHQLTSEQEMTTARLIAGSSPDPSTKIGATIIRSGLVVGVGVNRLKDGIKDVPGIWADKTLKYASVIHAEESAINDAQHRGAPIGAKGATMYIWGLPPCDACARAIAEAGLAAVVYKYARHPRTLNEYWRKRCAVGLAMLRRAGVRCIRMRSKT